MFTDRIGQGPSGTANINIGMLAVTCTIAASTGVHCKRPGCRSL